MKRIVIIGSGWISVKMIKAIRDHQLGILHGMYARNLEKTSEICKEFEIKHQYISFDDLLEDKQVDLIYFALSTGKHFEYLIQIIKKGIPVICEKPIVPTQDELIILQKHQKALIMEAFKTCFTPNFIQLQKHLNKVGNIKKVQLTFSRPSQEFIKVDNGQFDRHLSVAHMNTGLLDVGIYPIGVMIHLFGMPQSIESKLKQFDDGCDYEGFIICMYDSFNVQINYAKNILDTQANQILGDQGTLIFEHVSEVRTLHFVDFTGKQEDLSTIQDDNTLVYEMAHFIELLNGHKFESNRMSLNHSMMILQVMDTIRHQHQIYFQNEKKVHEHL